MSSCSVGLAQSWSGEQTCTDLASWHWHSVSVRSYQLTVVAALGQTMRAGYAEERMRLPHPQVSRWCWRRTAGLGEKY